MAAGALVQLKDVKIPVEHLRRARAQLAGRRAAGGLEGGAAAAAAARARSCGAQRRLAAAQPAMPAHLGLELGHQGRDLVIAQARAAYEALQVGLAGAGANVHVHAGPNSLLALGR